MKRFMQAVVIASLVSTPLVSFAQSIQPVTRAQVRADMVAVEKAGYQPGDWLHYPENLQAAEAKVAAQNATAQAGVSGYGGEAIGTSVSGRVAGQ